MKSLLSIKVYTRSANVELYHYSQKLISLPYERVRLYGTTADDYFYRMIEDDKCDIVINIDEDAFVVDNQALGSLIDYVIDNDIVCCGMNDGGVLPIRTYNPIIINPFFNIINLKALRERFDIDKIQQFDYNFHKKELISALPDDLKNYQGLQYDNYEPYYRFFFWIVMNFKVWYLPVAEHPDGCTTIVYNQDGNPVLYHTWWSREYGKDTAHTLRIRSIINEAYCTQGKAVPPLFWWRFIRWFEKKGQQFSEWWDWWIKLGSGRWFISHLKKSPMYYLRKIFGKGTE